MFESDYNGYLYEKALAVMTSIILSSANPIIKIKNASHPQLKSFVDESKKKLQNEDKSSFCQRFKNPNDECYSVTEFVNHFRNVWERGFIEDDNAIAEKMISSLLYYLLWLEPKD